MPSIASSSYFRILAEIIIVPAAILLVAGCAESEFATKSAITYERNDSAPPAAAKSATPAERTSFNAPGAIAQGQAGAEIPPAIPRKIVYNAQVALVVEDIGKVDATITKLVKDSGGYLSASDVSSYTNAQRTATWTVRMPVDRFDSFLESVIRLGSVEKNHVDSQDVTQEFYDIEARISNKQQEEKRLQKHLDDSTGKLEDILAVERELTRVRGEIEAAQGRLRYLANVSALSTITITASEIRDYKPPIRPTFGGRIKATFDRSVENLSEFVQGLVLIVVGLAPWIPVVVVLALPALWLLRWATRRLNWSVRLEPVNRPNR